MSIPKTAESSSRPKRIAPVVAKMLRERSKAGPYDALAIDAAHQLEVLERQRTILLDAARLCLNKTELYREKASMESVLRAALAACDAEGG